MRDHRPRDLSPTEVGFTRRRAVRWLDPRLLLGTGVRVALAYALGGYLDKRELQAALPGDSFDHSADPELWLDFTADGGDGFDATYTIAYLMARPELRPDGATQALPRGDLLVLGGDQVYPTASAKLYEDRWKGPYRAALPELRPDSPTLYALPGNHDWYDGLTAFLRLFAQEDPVGGWKTAQHRSYYALELPQRWWLLAIDIQLDSYIDEPQLNYFEEVARRLGPDDRVILVTPRPAWAMTGSYPDAYDSVDYFVRTVIEPTGARIPVMVAGDKHHYARYTESAPAEGDQPRELITCGGGGAYLTSTAHLPDAVDVPPESTHDRKASAPRQFELRTTYPAKRESRRLAWAIFGRLPAFHPGFVVLLGFMQTLLMLALLTAEDGRWLNAPIGFAAAGVLFGTYTFAALMGRQGRRHQVAGVVHAVPHVALGVAGAAVWTQLPFIDVSPPWATLLAFVIYLPVIGLLDTWIVAIYLLVVNRLGVNVNELHAGLAIDDYKAFLRMHIDPAGTLTVYPIGVRRVGRKWRADPDGEPGSPWIIPKRPIDTHLIETPIRVR